MVGQENIGSAWEIQENADMTIIINPEVNYETGELYMVFKMIKRRYRSIEMDEKLRRLTYFAHPFEPGNDIRLIDDFHMPKSLSVESLSTVAFDENATTEEITDIPKDKKKKKKVKYGEFTEDYDTFDLSTAMNY